MTSSESEAQARPRKRSRTDDSKNETVVEKKTRGRPRVDAQDATAADRRRTQIRLAQRAYRQRKETTIASLQQQTTQLHAIVQHMNKTFGNLNESVRKSGILQVNPALLLEFNQVSETFTNLGKTATESFNEGAEEDQTETTLERVHDLQGLRTEVHSHVPVQDERADIGWGYSVPTAPSPPKHAISQNLQSDDHLQQFSNSYRNSANEHEQSDLVRRRQLTVGDAADQPMHVQLTQYQQSAQSATNQPQHSQFSIIDVLSPPKAYYAPPTPYQYPVAISSPKTPPLQLKTPPMQMAPSPLATRTLAPIKSHAYGETSFARQLLRATLESAFRLLTYEGQIRPKALNHVFKLSLYFFDLEVLRTRFKDLLSRSINEELDWWEAPFLHLGGAGTHYPRRDSAGNIISERNSWTIRQIGPVEKRMVRVESVADGQWQEIDGMDLTGFEGEWFDAYDVQGYLEEHWGCKIDPSSSFAECWVDEEDESFDYGSSSDSSHSYGRSSNSPPLSQVSTATGSLGHQHNSALNLPMEAPPFGLDMPYGTAALPAYPNSYTKAANTDTSFDQTLGLDLAPGFSFGGQNFDMHSGWIGGGEPIPVVRQKSKKMAWIEVPTFINKMISQCVCLGRAPGFRRKSVDIAMRESFVAAC